VSRNSGYFQRGIDRKGNPVLSRYAGASRRNVAMSAGWVESKAVVDVPVPLENCWKMWLKREAIPQWMPWVKSVEVDQNDDMLSRWTLQQEALGQTFEFSWQSRNLPPLEKKLIHWRSVDGSMGGSGIGAAIQVKNKGAVKFRRKDEGTCEIQLVISYEVPDMLVPLGEGISPFVSGILQADMERFKQLAQEGKLELYDSMA